MTSFPFTFEQNFLRGQHETDGSTAGFGQRPISSGALRIDGPLDTGRLATAIQRAVELHPQTRAAVHPDGQEIRATAAVRIEERGLDADDLAPDARDRAAEEFVAACEESPFSERDFPPLRGYLGRFDENDAVLVLVGFLPLIDVWSIEVLLRDVTRLYAGEDVAAPPAYADYAAQQDAVSQDSGWADRLSGTEAYVLESDRPAAEHPSGTTRVDRFALDASVSAGVHRLAEEARASGYMVLLAAHAIELARATGRRRGLVWMLTAGPGRRDDKWADTVGYFANMCPLPVDLEGARTFRDAIRAVRGAALESLTHEVPFVELLGIAGAQLAGLERPGMVVPGFAMFQSPAGSQLVTAGDVRFAGIHRVRSQDAGPGIPDDAILWTIERGSDGAVYYALSSSVDRWEEPSVRAMAEGFTQSLGALVAAPDQPVVI
ncbi:condensation domain-containing protein [Myceligenerans salitolerans]|uniref:Condensation domain-containing protein n=1 Tax=Myceligenerans salitolerans TaxID=1230528 RepID=A0ABS3IFL8_9MICO|nr:condensation domain-containing protein [Myceligenerans salitolerans]MBO0611204.1 hypothetical protein [Myceligenerans salitolerans]